MSHCFRFLARPSSASDPSLWEIAGAEHHHLVKVLRLKQGDQIEVFDGCGLFGVGTVSEMTKETATVVCSSIKFLEPRKTQIVGLLSANQLRKVGDFLPALVELGIDHIHLFCSDGGARRDAAESCGSDCRYASILLAASKQCKTPWIPQHSHWPNLGAVVAHIDQAFSGKKLHLDPHAKQLLHATSNDDSTCFVVGPEKGLSRTEQETLDQSGFERVAIQGHILRASTAAIATVALLSQTSPHFSPHSLEA